MTIDTILKQYGMYVATRCTADVKDALHIYEFASMKRRLLSVFSPNSVHSDNKALVQMCSEDSGILPMQTNGFTYGSRKNSKHCLMSL